MIPGLVIGELEALLAEAAMLGVVPENRVAVPAFGRSPDLGVYKRWANHSLAELLQLPGMQDPAAESDIRLRIALHLSPPDAVDFDTRRPESRVDVIAAYLEKHFSFEGRAIERIARQVALVLDSWDTRRNVGLGALKGRLLDKQGYRCAACSLPFTGRRIELEEEVVHGGSDDPYKPYYDGNGVEAAMTAVVDHIRVVSKEGTNAVSNLQVLCALCNSGKGDNSGVKASSELEHCCLPIRDMPRAHRIRLLYYRLQMDGFRCRKCLTKELELTVRPVRASGLYVLTNLQTLCIHCI